VFGPKTGVFLLLATLTNIAGVSSSTTSAVTSSSTTSATSSSTTSVPVQAHVKVTSPSSSLQEQVLEPTSPVAGSVPVVSVPSVLVPSVSVPVVSVESVATTSSVSSPNPNI